MQHCARLRQAAHTATDHRKCWGAIKKRMGHQFRPLSSKMSGGSLLLLIVTCVAIVHSRSVSDLQVRVF